MFYSDDPAGDFLRHDRRMAERLERRPVCCRCGDHIQSEEAYEIEGRLYCPECIDDMKVFVEEDE